jgi:hypothetical protein
VESVAACCQRASRKQDTFHATKAAVRHVCCGVLQVVLVLLCQLQATRVGHDRENGQLPGMQHSELQAAAPAGTLAREGAVQMHGVLIATYAEKRPA